MNYKLDELASINGTSLKDTIVASPSGLIKLFGNPSDGDDGKVSGQYVFSDDENNVYTIYDWKETSYYDPDLPHPDVFWDSISLNEFHVGGKGDVSEFVLWVTKKLRG